MKSPQELFADYPLSIVLVAISAWELAWEEGQPEYFESIKEFTTWLHARALEKATSALSKT